MKNYSKASPRRDSSSAVMKSNQSLFMDESSEDLENYLNTPLTQSSTVTSDQVLLFEEDTGSPTINILSRKIKGQFLKTFSRPRKNKFFKSKTSLDKEIVVSNEIPVINEAMKKIFKGTSLSPNIKHSPKALKTYSNKRKEKSVVESFGLPDEPLLKLDVVHSEEQDSIDLETTHNDDNIDISLFSSWKPSYQVDCSDNTITVDFRRRSFSTPENISSQINLETEVKEGFNFEDDHLVQETPTKTDVLVKDKQLIVSLEHFNFNTLLRPNGLSLPKNKKQSLIENTESKLRNPKDHAEQQVGKSGSETWKFADSPKNNSCMRRSTRLKELSIETAGPSISEPSNLNSAVELNCESIKVINNSKENLQERKEESISDKPLNSDVFSPRRSSRISGIQGVLSSPLNKLNEKSSPIKKCRDNREKTNIDNYSSKFEDVDVSLKSSKSVNGNGNGNKFSKNVDVSTLETNLNSSVNNVNGIIRNGAFEKFVEPIASSSQRKSGRLQSKSEKVDENYTETKTAKDKERNKLKTSINNHDIQEMKSPVKKQRSKLRPQLDNTLLLPKHPESTELNQKSDKKVLNKNFSKEKNETITTPKKQEALRRSGRKSMPKPIDPSNNTDVDHNVDKKQINGIIKEKTRSQISPKFKKIENMLNDQVNGGIKISKNITTNSFQKESSVDASKKISHEQRNDKDKELTTSQTFNNCKNPRERCNSSDSKFNSPKHIVLENNISENPSLAANLDEIEFSINIRIKQKDNQTIVTDKNITYNKLEKILIQNNFHEGIDIGEETENSINDKLTNTSLDESVKKLDESSPKISDNGIKAFIKDDMKNQTETVNSINEKQSQNAIEIAALVKRRRGRPRKNKNLYLYAISKVEKCDSMNEPHISIVSSTDKFLTENDDNKIEVNIKTIDNKEDLKNQTEKCESMNGIYTSNVSPNINSEKSLTISDGNKIEANTENIDKKQDSIKEVEKCDSMNGTNTSNVSPNLNNSEKSLTKNDDKIEANTKNIDKKEDSNREKEEEIVFSLGNTKSLKKKIGEDKLLLHQQITQSFDGIKHNGDLVNKIIEKPEMMNSLEIINSKVLDNCESTFEKSCTQNSDSHEATISNREEENKNKEDQISDTFTECENTYADKNEGNLEIHQNINSNNPDLSIGTETNNSTKNKSKNATNNHENLDKSISSETKKEKHLTVSEINAVQTNGVKDVLDFGYDIHRRTSFRKILEKVMEVSRLEMEAKKSETARLHRCKSVPHEEFRLKKEINQTQFMSYSSDSKIRYLKEKKVNCLSIEYSRIKKHLNFDKDLKSLPRKRTKSMSSGLTKQQKLVENILKPLQEKEDEKIKDKIDDKVLEAEESKTDNFINSNVEHEVSKVESKNKDDFSNGHNEYSEENDIDQDDLEVANLLESKTSSDLSNWRRRSKSISEGVHKKKPSLSDVGRRSRGHGNKLSRASTPHFKLIKKVHEFKIGDLVWSKIGNYPYWPALIVEDPETSDFKKFKLLRATPYYHVRYFGDKGKRAWTVHCFPYEGQDDLEKLREKCFVEGYQSGDYQVKWSYKEKWYRAVQEAESIKNAPLETKLSFFDQPFKKQEKIELKYLESLDYPADIISRDRSKSLSFMTKDSKMAVKKNLVQSLVNKDLISSPHDSSISQTKSLVPSPKKRNISMKDSSVHSCIDNVITKYCSDQVKDSSLNSLKRKTKKSGGNRIESDSESDIVIGSKKIVKSKSPERKTKKIKGSPTCDSDNSELGFALLDVSIRNVSPDSTKRKCGDISDIPLQNSTPKSSKRNTKNDQIEDEQLETVTELDSSVILKTSRRVLRKSNSNQTENETEIWQNKLESPVKDSTLESTKRKTRKPKNHLNEDDNDESDLGLEALDIPAPENSSKKPEFSPKMIRSRYSARIGQKKISQEYEQEVKPQELLNECVSHLPEYKKNLFRGVPKERICQICEKPGDVVKCRGPCNGDFHIACNEKSFKDTEELTVKVEDVPVKEEKSDSVSSQEEVMFDNKQVEISTVVSRKKFADNVILSPVNKKIPLMEQFDRKMKEMMSQVESRIITESGESSSEEINISDKPRTVENFIGNNSKKRKSFMHVTADCDNEFSKVIHNPNENLEQINNVDEGVYKCSYCVSTVIPPCFVCNSVVSKKGNPMRQRCSLQKCGKYYHLECLNIWRQTQWSFILHDERKRKTEALDSFVCPRHSCHICTSENLGFSIGRCPNDKLVKCLRCPATYHNSYHCIPAGSEILTSTQIVCPRHVEGNKKTNTLNTTWCFVCSEGGNLICCETCPTSVHVECLPVNLLEDDTYMCEECECGRFPLYDEVVWVKCGCFRWWPAIILFPSDIPSNVESKPHKKGEFVVKFFGTYNYFWVGRGRVFLYQEGDTGYMNNNKNKIDEAFSTALREAADAYRFKKGLRAKKQKEVNNGLKPPPYVRIKVNRPVGKVKVFEGNLSNTTPCDCDPKDESPCGPNSNCLNRILLTECNPEICPAGQRCKNQCFEKREYPQLAPHRTAQRGWGLKTLEPIKKGRFVIEYVGEIIDDEEYQRRITRMHQQKDENYYFLTIDKDRMLDAGPKGNVARFMNHSCQPNCETQKWTVNGDTRVGLFAIENIPVDSELTFNYNLECVGTEKKVCRCGAPNCSGFIGVKPVNSDDPKPTKKNSSVKPVESEKQDTDTRRDSCFICGKGINLGKCSNKSCNRSYHLECVQLDSWPDGKWNCPSHSCNICSKRTWRICVLCNNSYCPYHSNGNIKYDDSLGYICNDHNQTKRKSLRRSGMKDGREESTPKKESNSSQKKEVSEGTSSRSERYRKRASFFEVNISPKRAKLEK